MNAIRVAVRNLRRNRRRTAITFASMVLSVSILIISFSLTDGMLVDMIHSITALTFGEVQVHHPRYRGERSIYDYVEELAAILEAAKEAGIHATPRSFGYGLMSSGSKSAGVQFWGVDPQTEEEAGTLPHNLLRGTYLPATAQKQVVLGRKLARTLHAEPGAELIVLVQAADGSIGNDIYTVAGIFKGAGESIDRSVAVIHRDDFGSLFSFPDKVHEIMLNSWGEMEVEAVAAAITSAAGGNEVLTWKQLLPTIARMLDMTEVWMLIFAAIFFLAAGLGVTNTMLMATYERIHEFGIVKAIGASPWRVLREILMEAVMLGFFASAIGVMIGIPVSIYLETHPIDLSRFAEGLNMSGVVFKPQWRASFSINNVVVPVVFMWTFSILASLWPAVKAARLDPVRALNHV